jgi:hypothetical protein
VAEVVTLVEKSPETVLTVAVIQVVALPVSLVESSSMPSELSKPEHGRSFVLLSVSRRRSRTLQVAVRLRILSRLGCRVVKDQWLRRVFSPFACPLASSFPRRRADNKKTNKNKGACPLFSPLFSPLRFPSIVFVPERIFTVEILATREVEVLISRFPSLTKPRKKSPPFRR